MDREAENLLTCADAGLFGLTRTLAKEWGPLAVNVNCVAFGLIDTRLPIAITDTAIISPGICRKMFAKPATSSMPSTANAESSTSRAPRLLPGW